MTGWTYGNGLVRNQVRNNIGRLTELNVKDGSANVQRLTSGYDAAGTRSSGRRPRASGGCGNGMVSPIAIP